ncbi:MAG: sensor histidine kinase [Chloroflexota bacterium]
MDERATIPISALERSPFGFARLDEALRITDLNSTLAGMLGVERRDALGRGLREFVPVEFHSEYDRAMTAIAGGDANGRGDISLKTEAGDFACTVSGSREGSAYYVIISDMTELKTLLKMRENEKMLEESLRMASVGVIAGGLTHEINQPLNAICIATDGIMNWNDINGRVLPEPFTKLIGRISGAAQRIDTIVKQIRMYWSAEPLIASEPTDPATLIENALSMIKQKIFNHEIKLDIDCPKGTGLIKVNSAHFEMIINNLALKAIDSLDRSPGNNKRLAIKLRRRSDKVEIRISDNGAGFRRVPFDKLFDPFERESAATDGSGLGLAIAQMLVNQNNGGIRQGDCSVGEEFIIEFPSAQDTLE